MTIQIAECDVIARTKPEALRAAKVGLRAQGWDVLDVVKYPYNIGQSRWRVTLAVGNGQEEPDE